MKNASLIVIAITGLSLSFMATGQSAIDADPAEPPPLPPKVQSSDRIDEPVVNIRTDDDGQIVEEYSQNGVVYMVKVTPKNAPPYYLFDDDLDGKMSADIETQPGLEPVHWKIAEF